MVVFSGGFRRNYGVDVEGIIPGTKIEITPISFGDVDLFSDWEIGLGWDIESTQLSAGPNEIRFDHFEFPGLVVGHFCSKQSMQNLFAVPEGTVVLVIPRNKLPLFWCGKHLPPSLMGVVRANREHWVKLPGGWDCYEFMISEELIQRTGLFPPRLFAETLRLERAFIPLLEPLTGRFVRQMDSYFRQARGVNGAEGAELNRARFFDFIIGGLQRLIDAGVTARNGHSPRAARRLDLASKGRDFVATHLTSEPSVEEMAQALGVSYRVLNYAFKDSLGLSPYQYMLTERLHAARRHLKSSEFSVTEACFAYGFNTPSRFARHYARLFGELPSETRYKNGRRLESTPAGP